MCAIVDHAGPEMKSIGNLRKWLNGFFIILLLAISSTSYCATDPNLQTPDESRLYDIFIAATLYKGQMQITFYPSYNHNADDSTTTLFPMSISYGVTDQWQATLDYMGYGKFDDHQGNALAGTGQVTFGVKYTFDNRVALGLDTTYPSGNPNLDDTPDYMDYNPYVVLSHVNGNNQLYTKVGINLFQKVKNSTDSGTGDDSAGANSLDWDAGYIFLKGRMSYGLEVDWDNDQWNNGVLNSIYVVPAIVISPNKSWEFGVSTAIGLTPSADKYDVLTYVSYLIDKT